MTILRVGMLAILVSWLGAANGWCQGGVKTLNVSLHVTNSDSHPAGFKEASPLFWVWGDDGTDNVALLASTRTLIRQSGPATDHGVVLDAAQLTRFKFLIVRWETPIYDASEAKLKKDWTKSGRKFQYECIGQAIIPVGSIGRDALSFELTQNPSLLNGTMRIETGGLSGPMSR